MYEFIEVKICKVFVRIDFKPQSEILSPMKIPHSRPNDYPSPVFPLTVPWPIKVVPMDPISKTFLRKPTFKQNTQKDTQYDVVFSFVCFVHLP